MSYGKHKVEHILQKTPSLSTDANNNTVLAGASTGNIRISKEPKTQGGIFCDWQANTGTLAMVSTDAGDDIALDTTVLLDGLPTAKCTFSNAVSGTYLADFTFANEVSLKNLKTLQIPVKITNNEAASNVGTAAAPFQVWIYLAGGSSIRLSCDFSNVPPDGWHVFSFGRYSGAGLYVSGSGATWASLDTLTVTKVRIVQATVAASVDYPVWIGPIRADARAVGRVSIVMDGEYSSQYTLIKPMLDQYGFKASLAIVNSEIGGSGRMTLAQLDEMYDAGHELIHHTYDGTKTNGYVNATDWPATADISADIKSQWDYFITNGWLRGIGVSVDAFASNFVSTVAAARQKRIKAAMSAAGVKCSRASVGLYTTQISLGYNGVKPYHLRGAIQITNSTTPADVQTIIDQAIDNGEWAIITMHRAVASSPSALEMTTADIDTWMAYLKTKVNAGTVFVEPMGVVYNSAFE